MASVRVAASVALMFVLVGAASARRMPLQFYGGSGSNAQASAQSGSGNYGYFGGSGSNVQASAQAGSGGGGYGGSGSNAQAGAQSGSGGGGYGGSGSNAQAQANSQSDNGGVIYSPGYGFIPQQQNNANANANAQVFNIICAGGGPCGPAAQQQPCYAGRPCPYGNSGGYYQGGPVAPILNGPIANAIRANVAAALGVAGRRHH